LGSRVHKKEEKPRFHWTFLLFMRGEIVSF